MANGWANENAVQEQIDATLDDAITKARSQLHSGESAEICEECGETIPEARRLALPGVRLCISCQNELDKKTLRIAAITAVEVKTASYDNSVNLTANLSFLRKKPLVLSISINFSIKNVNITL